MNTEISIWDNDAGRIRAIEANLYRAMRTLGLKGVVKIISEPPLLSRENLLDRVPVLEIMDQYWSLTPQTIITEEQCRTLLAFLYNIPTEKN
ncbi:hypothetical protein [Mailhella massiliensis]|uniref:Uncharacterized protein n=1 Tax=Mailhella massiliensis TaxID=1903261 RepID=A0A921DQT3_9BACT|nr:hypothetical protein [Mailhella massiliensis]HJD96875.1 hypothetical protein [Mailhella massiliensis]